MTDGTCSPRQIDPRFQKFNPYQFYTQHLLSGRRSPVQPVRTFPRPITCHRRVPSLVRIQGSLGASRVLPSVRWTIIYLFFKMTNPPSFCRLPLSSIHRPERPPGRDCQPQCQRRPLPPGRCRRSQVLLPRTPFHRHPTRTVTHDSHLSLQTRGHPPPQPSPTAPTPTPAQTVPA